MPAILLVSATCAFAQVAEAERARDAAQGDRSAQENAGGDAETISRPAAEQDARQNAEQNPLDLPPPPRELEELIPSEALDNARDWALDGSIQGPASQPAVQEVPAPDEPVLSNRLAPLDEADSLAPVTSAAPNAETSPPVLNLAEPIKLPDPLEEGAGQDALAEIEGPQLIDLPDLAPVKISDTLVLALPSAEGAFPEQERFIERFEALSRIKELGTSEQTVPQLAARARADADLLRDVLRNYGYYDGEIVRQLSGGRRGDSGDENGADDSGGIETDPQVRFEVLPGPRYEFGAIDLGSLAMLPDKRFDPLRGAFAIQPGDPLYADRIPEEITNLRDALGESGYPFFTIAEPELVIDHAALTGDLSVPVDPGGRYVFDTVISSQPDFLSGEHLADIARFSEGDLYERSKAADLRRAVLATGLVSTAVISARPIEEPQDDEPGRVALDVELEPAPLRTVSGALGYGTEEGIRIEAGWEHRNLFPPEGALRFRGIVGTQEQLASVSFQRSNWGRRDQILTIDAYASDLDTDAIDARTIALRGTFERVSNLLFQKPLSFGLGAELLYSEERNSTFFDTSVPREEYLIGGLFARATIDTSNDLLDPDHGFRLIGSLAPDISRSQGQTSFYTRTGIEGAYYQPAGPHVIAGRLNLQTIVGADRLDIAPSRRLYAGGGGSVRGYAFQAIGPRDDFGNPLGGRSLVEFSLEARIQTGFFDSSLEVVPFVDAGSVNGGSAPDFGLIRFGAGLGVRYKTSFGPIRVDLGVPLNPDEFDAPVAVYVSLGQAF